MDPYMPLDDEQIARIKNALNETATLLANMHAAMRWSEPSEELLAKYDDEVVVVAIFGGIAAVNGNIVEVAEDYIPRQFVRTGEGGEISSAFVGVAFDKATAYVAKKLQLSRHLVRDVTGEDYGAMMGWEIPRTVSGVVDIYAYDEEAIAESQGAEEQHERELGGYE